MGNSLWCTIVQWYSTMSYNEGIKQSWKHIPWVFCWSGEACRELFPVLEIHLCVLIEIFPGDTEVWHKLYQFLHHKLEYLFRCLAENISIFLKQTKRWQCCCIYFYVNPKIQMNVIIVYHFCMAYIQHFKVISVSIISFMGIYMYLFTIS